VVQGIHGGGKIVKYLDFAAWGLGFRTVKGTCHTAFEPMTAKEQAKRDAALAKQAAKFHEQLSKPAHRSPSLIELALFRFARSSMSVELGECDRDWQYYRERGWFESDYYYPTHLGVGKRMVGRLADAFFLRMSKARA
jgi:hypothetical protein